MILESLMDCARQHCVSLSHLMNDNAIRLTALTGSAATEIKGTTVHSACKISGNAVVTDDDIEEWLNTRLLVIDETSFADCEEVIFNLQKSLQKLTNEFDAPHGSMNIVFIGDFLQLEPARGKAMHSHGETLCFE